MSQNYNYPTSSSVTITGTPNGAPIPSTSLLIAGENVAGNQQVLQTDSSGNLLVSIAAEPGAPFAMNMIQVGGSAITLGQKTGAASLPVVIASDQGPVISGSAQSTLTVSTSSLATTAVILGYNGTNHVELQVDATGHLLAAQQGTWNIGTVSTVSAVTTVGNITGTITLPTGAATAANQTSVQGSATGGTAATSSELVGAKYNSALPTLTTGQQASLQVDSSARLIVSPLTNTSVVKAQLQDNTGAAIVLGQTTSAGSLPVVIATDQTTVPVSLASSPLPTGAATSANQTTQITQLTAINTNTTGLNNTITTTGSAVPTSAVQLGVKNGSNLVALTEGQATSANSLPVVLASDQSAVPSKAAGTASANAPVYNVYSSTSITTAAYTQLVASTTSVTNTIHIFDSSGQAMILATGASGSEVVQLYIPPGGDTYTLTIPAGTRIAYKALTATASSGYLLMSFLQ